MAIVCHTIIYTLSQHNRVNIPYMYVIPGSRFYYRYFLSVTSSFQFLKTYCNIMNNHTVISCVFMMFVSCRHCKCRKCRQGNTKNKNQPCYTPSPKSNGNSAAYFIFTEFLSAQNKTLLIYALASSWSQQSGIKGTNVNEYY